MERPQGTDPALLPGKHRFLCDEMLHGLGRWLRAAGYDTAIAGPGLPDHQVLRQALDDNRVLLTCDRALAERRPARGRALALTASGLDAGAAELRRKLCVDWLHAPFTRCLLDNAPVRPADPAARSRLPAKARALPGPVTTCPVCARLYWPGSHARRMLARPSTWQDQAQAPA